MYNRQRFERQRIPADIVTNSLSHGTRFCRGDDLTTMLSSQQGAIFNIATELAQYARQPVQKAVGASAKLSLTASASWKTKKTGITFSLQPTASCTIGISDTSGTFQVMTGPIANKVFVNIDLDFDTKANVGNAEVDLNLELSERDDLDAANVLKNVIAMIPAGKLLESAEDAIGDFLKTNPRGTLNRRGSRSPESRQPSRCPAQLFQRSQSSECAGAGDLFFPGLRRVHEPVRGLENPEEHHRASFRPWRMERDIANYNQRGEE